MRILKQRLFERESEWCRRANRRCGSSSLRHFMRGISRLGDGVFWYSLMAGLMLFGGTRGAAAALHLAATGIMSQLLYRGLKRWTKRARPCASDALIKAWIAPLDEFSFPSGHTLHAIAFSIVAIAYFPPLSWLLLPFCVCVALSRVLLGLHYPSDVLAAIGIGIGLGKLSLLAGELADRHVALQLLA